MKKNPQYGRPQDDVIVLAVLVVICTLGIFLVGEPHRSDPSPRADTDGVDTARRDVAPVSVAIALKPDLKAPMARPLGPSETLTSGSSFITVFGDRELQTWLVADRTSPTIGFWRSDFRRAQAHADANGLRLSMGRQTDEADTPYPWAGGEVRSTQKYGYGRYDVVMKPARGSGLVSAFFTYTGPESGDPHDEIDIEFVGNNTRKVEFNAWRSGRSYGAKTLTLPFDAADAFHLYGFEWHPDSVTWFIDGLPVHRVDAIESKPPRTPAHVFFNLWAGKMNGWHGPPRFREGAAADYACVSFQATGESGRTCADLFRARDPLTPDWVITQD